MILAKITGFLARQRAPLCRCQFDRIDPMRIEGQTPGNLGSRRERLLVTPDRVLTHAVTDADE
jgi:hypothetical protein